MRRAPWLDHLLPWLSFGAIAATGVYEPWELGIMAWPLVAAGVVEGRRWGLGRHHRLLEIFALVLCVLMAVLRLGLVPVTVNTLFLLCGVRLALPRELPQRRQLLLMSFLLFLTTAIANFDLEFILWTLAWLAGAAGLLLHQAWESSANLRRGLAPPAPFRKLPAWVLASLVGAGLIFLLLPRPTLGFRFFPWGIAGLTGSVAGLSDRVDLGDTGPIAPSREVVLRILPGPSLDPSARAALEAHLALLPGLTLEEVEGPRWEPGSDFLLVTSPGSETWWEQPRAGDLPVEFIVSPNPLGVIPRPYGIVKPLAPLPMPLRTGRGASLRWQAPSRRTLPLRLLVHSRGGDPRPRMTASRAQALTRVDPVTESAGRWSRRVVPAEVEPRVLAESLSAELSRWTYSLENPSGRAEDPLADFLERGRTGHCEYFASALALALRHRGVPAVVVNGYRLGPWIEAGGYWLVTENEAHSWVEWWEASTQRWQVADPTPPGFPSALAGTGWLTRVQQWLDALRFRWDRHVVRFSDQDQVAGLDWLQGMAQGFRPPDIPRTLVGAAASLITLAALTWALRRILPAGRWAASRGPGSIPALRPLVRRAGRADQPRVGETARAWILRLREARPDRAEALDRLADEADAVGYRNAPDGSLRARVRAEVRAWRRR